MAFPNQVMKRMSNSLHDVQQTAGSALSNVGETAGELLEQGRERVKQVAHQFDDSLHDHPMRWMLIGVGIGCLMGALLVRR